MKYVFICSPLSGDIEGNMDNARKYCALAIRRGFVPFAPHIYFPQFLDDSIPAERNIGLAAAKMWVSLCEEMWVFGPYISEGMSGEIELAKRSGISIRYFNFDD